MQKIFGAFLYFIRNILYHLLNIFGKRDKQVVEHKVEELKKKDDQLKKEIEDGKYKTVEEAMKEWKQ